MKLLYTSLFGLMLCFQGLSQNQMSKSIAVANPNVNNLSIKSEIAAKMMRLELIKIDKYRVLDEFDMADVIKSNASFSSGCYGLNCLSDIGEGLKVDYVLCGSFDGLGNKIAITLKMVDVKNRTIYQSLVKEFDNQEPEIQRMIEQMFK
jgi:TolB-like protein